MPELPKAASILVAPDWGCEILSPSTEAIDRAKKGRGVKPNESLAKEGFAQALETARKNKVYTPKWIHTAFSAPSCHIVIPKDASAGKISFDFTTECQDEILQVCKTHQGRAYVR